MRRWMLTHPKIWRDTDEGAGGDTPLPTGMPSDDEFLAAFRGAVEDEAAAGDDGEAHLQELAALDMGGPTGPADDAVPANDATGMTGETAPPPSVEQQMATMADLLAKLTQQQPAAAPTAPSAPVAPPPVFTDEALEQMSVRYNVDRSVVDMFAEMITQGAQTIAGQQVAQVVNSDASRVVQSAAGYLQAHPVEGLTTEDLAAEAQRRGLQPSHLIGASDDDVRAYWDDVALIAYGKKARAGGLVKPPTPPAIPPKTPPGAITNTQKPVDAIKGTSAYQEAYSEYARNFRRLRLYPESQIAEEADKAAMEYINSLRGGG